MSIGIILQSNMTTSSELASKILDSAVAKKSSKQKILEEDEYLKNIEAIVQRDFFPDIPELQKKLDYFEAVSQNDPKKAEELRQRLTTDFRDLFAATPANKQLSGPSQYNTPNLGDTEELDNDGYDNLSDIEAKRLPKLDSFLQRYTSEDNASFSSLMNETEKRRIIKYGWAYPALMKAYREAERRIASIETHKAIQYGCVRDGKQAADGRVDAETELDADEAVIQAITLASGNTPGRTPFRGAIATTSSSDVSTGKQPERTEESGSDHQARSIETWKTPASPMSALMFSSSDALNPLTKRESTICLENTRFDASAHEVAAMEAHKRMMDELSAAQAAGLSQGGRVGVDGLEQSAFGNATPRVGGWKLAYTPTPDPSALRSPLMTWGVLEGTPNRLDTGNQTPLAAIDASVAHFKIPEMPARDQLAHELCDRVTSASRGTKQRGLDHVRRTGSGASGASKRTESPFLSSSALSPAARALSGRLVRPSTGMAAALQRTYSPAPSKSSSSACSTPRSHRPASGAGLVSYGNTSERRTPRSATISTPLRSSSTASSARRVGGSITDNLLDDLIPPSIITRPSVEPSPKRSKNSSS